jgi:acetylornithine deacetylase/succinyl-diaminopimelate desuccinylase-like protein
MTTDGQLEAEVIQICQDLIRIPSVNFGEGKGNEKEAADYVVASLAEVGIVSTVYESAPGRCNVIARIKGSDSTRPGLVVHGHLDVVPANADDWSVDPFCGDIIDGMIWGRGAVDMKGMDAMILAIARKWGGNGYKPPRDIVLAFFADEEAGSVFGSRWMVDKHPDVFAGCSQAISEVGGFSVTLKNGKRLYPVQSAEKGYHWMRLTATGRAGHGLMINEENAVSAVAEAVTKIAAHVWPQKYTRTVKEFFATVAKVAQKPIDMKDFRPLLTELGSASRMIRATLQHTANPTMLEAGYKANVIPQSASAVVDGRFLPGFEDEFQETLANIVGPNIEITTIAKGEGLEFPFDGAIYAAMHKALLMGDPDGTPVPFLMGGFTDNKSLAKLGIEGYGFAPLLLPPDLDFMSLFHGVDERVPVDGLTFGVRVLESFLENC